jgi:hypothetical protein
MTRRGFGALNDAHEELGEMFLLHQECLVAGHFELARELLGAYRSMIQLHMRHEEQLVMPIYLRAENPRWPQELYTGQHEKLLALLDRAEGVLKDAHKAGAWRRTSIEILDIQSTFKNLVEHHHLAEDQAFYPTADAESTEDERARIVDECAAQWAEASAANGGVVERVRAALDADARLT